MKYLLQLRFLHAEVDLTCGLMYISHDTVQALAYGIGMEDNSPVCVCVCVFVCGVCVVLCVWCVYL